MGHRYSTPFTEEELQDYQDLTYFTQKEILYVFEKFKSLDPDVVKQNKNARLPIETVMKLSELNVNPFKDRLCKIFSSENDNRMSFEDFLDMMSVLSSRACKNIKTEYAFRIYDFDEDDLINEQDLRELIRRLISKEERVMQEEDMKELIDHILAECDMDEDNCLSFTEFEHVISKSADFVKDVIRAYNTEIRDENTWTCQEKTIWHFLLDGKIETPDFGLRIRRIKVTL